MCFHTLQDRLARMRQDVARFLDNIWSAGDPVEIGLIQFNEFSKTLHEMTHLNTEADLQSLKDAIPDSTVWGTCIGCGLLEGLEVNSWIF